MGSKKGEIPLELLEREMHGLEVELSQLRHQHKVITDRIVELERERFALDCKIRARQMP